MYLVDTSVWVEFLRGNVTPQVQVLRNLLSGQKLSESHRSFSRKSCRARNRLNDLSPGASTFRVSFCYVPKDPVQSYVAAARMYQRCRSEGKTPRSSNDCLIAQIAIESRLTLLHGDRDFDAIASAIGELRLYSITG